MLLHRNLRKKLREDIARYFRNEDIRDLCFDLGIEYEDLGATTRGGLARELVDYCIRHECLAELLQLCQFRLPNHFTDAYLYTLTNAFENPVPRIGAHRSIGSGQLFNSFALVLLVLVVWLTFLANNSPASILAIQTSFPQSNAESKTNFYDSLVSTLMTSYMMVCTPRIVKFVSRNPDTYDDPGILFHLDYEVQCASEVTISGGNKFAELSGSFPIYAKELIKEGKGKNDFFSLQARNGDKCRIESIEINHDNLRGFVASPSTAPQNPNDEEHECKEI